MGSRSLRVVLTAALSIVAGAAVLQAQEPAAVLGRSPTVSPVPQEFVGIWAWKTPRQSCGSTVDSYGQPATFDSKPGGRPLCQWPIDRLEKVLNGRGRAWREFTRNGADDVISPRWTCVAAGLGTVLTEGYLRAFYKRADSLVMHFDQSNWFRPIWTDGRQHPPATDAFYHGHAIGVMDGKTFVVETTNLTWDPDGYDDHSHIARSHMAKFTERYTLKSKDSMELAITVDDPVFLREPFTFVGELVRSSDRLAATWDCDPETSLRELYSTVNNPYPDDTAAERILGR